MRDHKRTGAALFVLGMVLIPVGTLLFGPPLNIDHDRSGIDRVLGPVVAVLAFACLCAGAWLDSRDEDS